MPFNLRKVLADGGAIYICTYTYMHAYIIFHDRAKLSAYTGPKIVIGLRPWYKFDKRSDTGSNIENIIPVILGNASPI